MRIHRPGDRHRTLWSSVRRCRRRGVGGRVKVSGRNAVKRGRGNCCQNETPFARGEGSGAGVVERTRSRHIASSPSYVPQGDPARFRPLAHAEGSRSIDCVTGNPPLAIFCTKLKPTNTCPTDPIHRQRRVPRSGRHKRRRLRRNVQHSLPWPTSSPCSATCSPSRALTRRR